MEAFRRFRGILCFKEVALGLQQWAELSGHSEGWWQGGGWGWQWQSLPLQQVCDHSLGQFPSNWLNLMTIASFDFPLIRVEQGPIWAAQWPVLWTPGRSELSRADYRQCRHHRLRGWQRQGCASFSTQVVTCRFVFVYFSLLWIALSLAF